MFRLKVLTGCAARVQPTVVAYHIEIVMAILHGRECRNDTLSAHSRIAAWPHRLAALESRASWGKIVVTP